MDKPLLPFMIHTAIVPSGEVRDNPIDPFFAVLSTVSGGLCAYHGWKRNESIGWALAWGFGGALLPVIGPAIAFAQGFGEPR